MSPTGYVFYEGPSALDGAPIVGIATGLVSRSTNRKTGPIVQTWILRSDVHPVEAVQTGRDAAICGDCVHRGRPGVPKTRSCYVVVGQGVAAVYRAYHAGLYPPSQGRPVLARRFVRVGAYGDPVAVPLVHWLQVLDGIAGHVGYTHQWRTAEPRAVWQRFLMASVDSAAEWGEAHRLGWRTFRTRSPLSPLLPGEVICPASAEAGHRLTCETCRACTGGAQSTRASIAIEGHGSAPTAFFKTRQAALAF